MTDVLIYQTVDDGEINVENGIVEMSGGLESSTYLSMFGGAEWWGNIGETLPERQYTAKTQAALETLPPSSANLLRIEQAAADDLQWQTDSGVADSVAVAATIPALGRVCLTVSITVDGQNTNFEFIEDWEPSA